MASPITTVRDELSLVQTLSELMKQEQRLLVAADTDGLTAITPQKNQLVGQLAALSAERHQNLAAAGFAADDAAMHAWIAEQKDADAASLWEDLLAATREAKELNRVNGMLISKHLSTNQQLINAMRAPAGGADAAVYGPTGQTAPSGPSRRYVVG
jgi:flagella synthesis protein FlgN